MKTTFATLLLGALATVASAQTAPEAKAPVTAPSAALFNSVSVDETLVFWGKTNVDTVVELDSSVQGKLYDIMDWHITVPVYSQDSTGYGAIDLGVDYLQIVERVGHFGHPGNVGCSAHNFA